MSGSQEPYGLRSAAGRRAMRQRTVRSLGNRNYRTYLTGHGLSNIGMWTQQTAELWLILQLTGSGTAVGMHSVLRFGPVLLFGTYGGLISDRIDRRMLLIGSQLALALAALTLTIAAWGGSPSLALIYSVVGTQGLINALDHPLRRAFVRDLVSDDDLANAIGLHGSISTLSRAIGPAIAGFVIAGVGLQWCFLFNFVTYAAMLVAVFRLNPTHMRPQVLAKRSPRQVREGFAFAWSTRSIRTTLLMTLAVAVFGWNWQVLVPFYATREFGGGASLYGMLVSVLSVGAVIGALNTARLLRVGGRHLAVFAAVLSGALLLVAVAPTLPMAFAALFIVGASGSAFVVGAQTRLQLTVSDVMSGRVLALYSVTFVGSKPLGGYLGGVLTDLWGVRPAFALAGIAIAIVILVLRPPRRAQRFAVSDAPRPDSPKRGWSLRHVR